MLPVATSTMDATPASSFETKIFVPSDDRSKASGSEPAGSTRDTVRVAASTTATPSFDLSEPSFSHSASGMEGGHLGEPLRATKTHLPSRLTFTPRGRVPTAMVPMTESLSALMIVRSCESSFVT